ncbi:MAG: hypothetical protein ACXWUG_13980 [Polyangiales bacterium]
MKIAVASLACLALLVGCSNDDSTPSGSNDTGLVDSAVADTLVVADTFTAETDAEPMSETSTDSSSDTMADTVEMLDTAPVCTPSGLGTVCNDSNPCPTDMRCYGFGDTGYCAPMMPECGGFVDTKCKDGRACMRTSGSSLGYCATFDERLCICSKATSKIDGCPDPDAGK